jgi:hypothetical protein
METLFGLLIFLGLMSPTNVVSPLPDTIQIEIPEYVTKPSKTFADIVRIYPTSVPQVLGASAMAIGASEVAINPISSQSATTPLSQNVAVTSTPSALPITTKKTSYKIAILGDSMVDTLGDSFPELTSKLKAQYPNVSFTILNHGVASKNINDGLTRLIKPYDDYGVQKQSVVSQKPDIIIVESFGYNPYGFEEGALDTHWLAMAYIIDTIKQELPDTKILMFATIAPNAQIFGDGVPTMTLDALQKLTKTNTIKSYLDNAVKFAKSQNLPIADAYHKSMDNTGNGKSIYINATDHIHYSQNGKEFVSSIIADSITNDRLLE